jgi:hypothetical protein
MRTTTIYAHGSHPMRSVGDVPLTPIVVPAALPTLTGTPMAGLRETVHEHKCLRQQRRDDAATIGNALLGQLAAVREVIVEALYLSPSRCRWLAYSAFQSAGPRRSAAVESVMNPVLVGSDQTDIVTGSC